MRKLLIILLISLMNLQLSCKKTSAPDSNNSDIISYSTPIAVIDSFIFGLQNYKLELVDRYYVGNIELSAFKDFNISSYYIVNEDKIIENETLYRQKGDVVINVAIVVNHYDTVIYDFNIRNFDIGWRIIGYSSEYENKMEEDLQNTIEEVPTNLDSLDSYKNRNK